MLHATCDPTQQTDDNVHSGFRLLLASRDESVVPDHVAFPALSSTKNYMGLPQQIRCTGYDSDVI